MWRETIIGLGALVLIASAVVWLFMQIDGPPRRPPPVTHETYTNATYGYTVSYPAGSSLLEHTPEIVALGSTTPLGVDASVELALVESGGEAGYGSLSEYVFERTRLLCAADGPDETLNCDQVLAQETFTTAQGRAGMELYLRLLHTRFSTGETIAAQFGPIYAFDMREHVPASPFAVLLIYQPLPSFMAEPHPETVRGVARSFTLP